MDELIKKVQQLGEARVMLVGDFMLDRYVYGDADRLSPEAPVPVLRVRSEHEETRNGGAGNVAAAVLALGAKVRCIGVIGQDDAGREINRMLASLGAETSNLMKVPSRPTTVKTRYVGLAQHRHPQQILRVDSECGEPLDAPIHNALQAAVQGGLADCNIVAIEDYDKGTFDEVNTPALIATARKAGLEVVVDPACIASYARYQGATVLTPNRYETELASGIAIADDASLRAAAQRVLTVTQAKAVLVTLDREGMFLAWADGTTHRFPTTPRSVYDVAGAGDEVLAALAVALGEGWALPDAVHLANLAGGLEVERFGVEAITRQEVIDELYRVVGLRGGKVVDRHRLVTETQRRKANGETIVFTNGCFDLLHMGHLRYLRQAREQGTCLIVAVNSDDSVRRLKGPHRPVIGQDERAEMLGALECVDFVTIFDEDTPEALLDLVRPDILVKGGSTDVIVGREIVEGYGGQVRRLDLVQGLSTTIIIEKILRAETDEGDDRDDGNTDGPIAFTEG